jgi:hypothetical protein
LFGLPCGLVEGVIRFGSLYFQIATVATSNAHSVKSVAIAYIEKSELFGRLLYYGVNLGRPRETAGILQYKACCLEVLKYPLLKEIHTWLVI